MTDARRSMEEPLYRRILAGMDSWLSRVRTVVMAAWNRFRGRPDPMAVAQTQPLWDQVINTVVPDMLRAAKLGWSETTSRPYTGHELFVFNQMAKVRNLLRGIPDEVSRMIADEISRAVASGASPQTIAEQVQKMLEVTGSPYWPHRARTIAVTSVHSMANAGSQAAMLMLQARSDGQLLKEWVSREDERVRPSHHVADGQRVPVASYFMVGNSAMLFPGDPAAPAGEVVNCRCSMKLVEA